MELSDITSALSSAAPYAGAITALANLGIDITKAVTPDQIAEYEAQHQARVREATDRISALVANPLDAGAARSINDFDDELCALAGQPVVGGVRGVTVTIRVDRWLAHITAASEEIRDHGIILAGLAYAQRQQPVTPATPAK